MAREQTLKQLAHSTLTHRLLVRVMSYFETQLQVLETRDMTAQEMLRWFIQTLDNVRARHRKLLRFGKWVHRQNLSPYMAHT